MALKDILSKVIKTTLTCIRGLEASELQESNISMIYNKTPPFGRGFF